MDKLVDLHTHSTASDGTDTPSELIEKAKNIGLSAIALTDHDCFDGLEEASKKAEEVGIELIKGVEFSTEYKHGEVHILGYWLHSNPLENPSFKKVFERLLELRNERNEKLFKKLETLGMPIDKDEVLELTGNSMICRPHLARIMVKKKYVKNINIAFSKYLGMNGVAYVPKQKFTQQEAIDILRDSNAVVSFAHPYLTPCRDEKERKELIKSLADKGIHAIETYYSMNNDKQTTQTLAYTREFNLLPSGGSDYHGTLKPNISLGSGKGRLKIHYSILEDLRKTSI